MHRKYLGDAGARRTKAYRDINFLLERGVAYHHSGMLPILRDLWNYVSSRN